MSVRNDAVVWSCLFVLAGVAVAVPVVFVCCLLIVVAVANVVPAICY